MYNFFLNVYSMNLLRSAVNQLNFFLACFVLPVLGRMVDTLNQRIYCSIRISDLDLDLLIWIFKSLLSIIRTGYFIFYLQFQFL